MAGWIWEYRLDCRWAQWNFFAGDRIGLQLDCGMVAYLYEFTRNHQIVYL